MGREGKGREGLREGHIPITLVWVNQIFPLSNGEEQENGR